MCFRGAPQLFILLRHVQQPQIPRLGQLLILENLPDLFGQICPDCPELAGRIQVRDVTGLYFWLDAISSHAICGFEKNFYEALDKIDKMDNTAGTFCPDGHSQQPYSYHFLINPHGKNRASNNEGC